MKKYKKRSKHMRGRSREKIFGARLKPLVSDPQLLGQCSLQWVEQWACAAASRPGCLPPCNYGVGSPGQAACTHQTLHQYTSYSPDTTLIHKLLTRHYTNTPVTQQTLQQYMSYSTDPLLIHWFFTRHLTNTHHTINQYNWPLPFHYHYIHIPDTHKVLISHTHYSSETTPNYSLCT